MVLLLFTVIDEPGSKVKVIGAPGVEGLPIIRLSPPALAKLVFPIFQTPLRDIDVAF